MKPGHDAARRIAQTALLAALTLVLGSLELLLPPVPFLPPGAKPGLGNIVIMYTLLRMGIGGAIPLTLVKALFAFFLRGAAAGFLSLSGGLCSLLALFLLQRCSKRPASYALLGVTGALLHNTGQLLACMLLMDSAAVLWYLPALCLFGVGTGIITGFVLKLTTPYLDRLVP